MVDDADDLTLIPRGVRDKLDRVGIKLHLREWSLFALSDRVFLRDATCDTPDDMESYRQSLEELVERHTGHPAERLNSQRGESPRRRSA